jgi:hypothetical protein
VSCAWNAVSSAKGLFFSAYHRVSTVIFAPGPSGSAVEMVTIDPLDLQAALEQDAAMNTMNSIDRLDDIVSERQWSR